MIFKGEELQPKVFAPKPIRSNVISRTCMAPFQTKIPQFLIKSTDLKPPRKKNISALDLIPFAEMERDFTNIVMRNSREDAESTEELYSILSNTNNNDENNSSLSDQLDNQPIPSNEVERSLNPFLKNFKSID